MNWKPELDDLARREAFAREMGGVDKVKRQRDQGRLTVRERIDKLVDTNSFHEVGAIAGVGEYDEHGNRAYFMEAVCIDELVDPFANGEPALVALPLDLVNAAHLARERFAPGEVVEFRLPVHS